MITEQDLLDAIAECQGVKHPTSQTCIKLASYLTILEHLNAPDTKEQSREFPHSSSSGSSAVTGEPVIRFDSDSDFAKCINGKPLNPVLRVVEEALQTIQAFHPKLYDAVMRQFDDI